MAKANDKQANTTVSFTFEKATKSTFRFAETVADGAEPVIGTLYIKQAALGGVEPKGVTVTIEVTA